jgi:hypothetical protein
MVQAMSSERLRLENEHYHNTAGVSSGNRQVGFLPAFCDLETGRTELSRFARGGLAPLHLLNGLPKEWIRKRDACGNVLAVKASVIAGFLRDGCFYTRDEAARAAIA